MKYLFLLIYTTILFSVNNTIAQQAPNVPTAIYTDTLAQKFAQRFQKDQLLAQQIANINKLTLRNIDDNGRIIEFDRFDANGNMLFNITNNIGAGRTISTNKVWPGGTVGTSLTGSGMANRLGEWDGGAVRRTHQELSGRVTQVDGSTNFTDHATHVAGTLIATGISANAKGMAYQATLNAYDWNNDEAEMQQAGAAGMLISNHSYGTIAGWHYDNGKDYWYGDPAISTVEDYKFGFYDETTAEWDEIAFNNPHYLICKAAGNDRGNTRYTSGSWYYSNGSTGSGTPPPADGQYDCIPTYATAKNILTVGAVQKISNSNNNNGWTKISDVVMSSFSGWGPTDDGRIKPDVVGCGVNIYSSMSTSNNSYDTQSGTSMASPNVAGSLLLVQQHYHNLKSKYMRSATLKGLVIHTADEAGNIGPDYTYGWGLVNIAKAVQYISDSVTNQIQENTLTNGSSLVQTISSTGVLPLRVTICWTDRAGTPVAPVLDPTNRMLVNDLDIKLVRTSDNVTFLPYILNPATPAATATTGDNIRDNVEQIYIATPEAGTYTLTVSHKGSLVGSTQAYSLIVSGVVGMPTATFQASSHTACIGNVITFTDVSGGLPSSRFWYFPGGTPATSTDPVVNVTYSNTGNYSVALKVDNALGSDSIFTPNYVAIGGLNLPFNETFESNSPTADMWTIENPNSDITWAKTTVTGTTPGNTAYYMNFYAYGNTGRRDGLISPTLNFKGYASASLTFAHAYARDPGYPSDSLIIYISTDCGNIWTQLRSYAADSLKTAPDNTNEFIPLSAASWCTANCKTINLGAYLGMSNIRIKFESYNRNNNNLYIDNINITGTPLAPVANFYTYNSTICQGKPINFYDSSEHIPVSWEWSFDGAETSSSTSQNPEEIVYNNLGTYSVKLKIANTVGSDSITKTNYITVVAAPEKPVINALHPPAFCTGDSTILTFDSSAGIYYKWILDGTVLNTSAQTLVVKTSGVYQLRATNSSGCIVWSDSVIVDVNDMPATPVITSNLSGNFLCTGGTAVLTSNANSGNQWYKNGLIINGASNQTLSVTDSGNYTVVVYAGGCASAIADAKQIDLLPAPNTSEITGADTVVRTQTETYTVTDHPGSTYTWTITGGTKVSGDNTSSIQVQWNTAGNGNVQVQETGNNGCKGPVKSHPVLVSFGIGLNETEFIKAISVYPNPASQQVNIKLESIYKQDVTIRIVTLLGQTLDESKWNLQMGNNEKQIPISHLDKGVYFIEMRTDNETLVKRLIVQ